MAHTADLRSEGEKSETAMAKASRDNYKRLKQLGLCVACGKVEVKNRTYCYDCSKKASASTALWGARKILADAGVNVDQCIDELIELTEGREQLDNLIQFLALARK